jgi:hypothetical protein
MKTIEIPNLRIRAYSEHSEVYQFAEYLVDDYLATKERVRDRNQYLLTARKLIASIWLVEGDLFKFTTKDEYFSKKERKQVWMTKKVLKLFRHLKSIEPKLINVVVKGVPPDVSKSGKGLNTVYSRAFIFTQRLKSLKEADILPDPELEVIELKDEDKKPLPIPSEEREQEWFIRSTEILNKHFEFLRNSNLTYSDGSRIAPLHYFYQRKFKLDFLSGGRWYSDFNLWSKKKRLSILLNNESALSIDISQLHPSLIMRLYHHQSDEPIGLMRGELKDAYDMPKYDYLPRVVHKKLINTLFNSITQESALKSIMTAHLDVNEDGEYVCNTYKGKQKRKGEKIFKDNMKGAREYMSYFKFIHPYYSEAICSGIGIKLQHMDSRLVTNMIDVATTINLPILPVHDEFVFPEKRLDDMKELLRRVFQITYGALGQIGTLNCKLSDKNGDEKEISLNLENSSHQ